MNILYFETLQAANNYVIKTTPFVAYCAENKLTLYCKELAAIIVENGSMNVYYHPLSYNATSKLTTQADNLGTVLIHNWDSETGDGFVIYLNGITSIGNDAFSNCSNLTSIIIPNSVISLGERVFDSCTNLTSVTIGNSVTSIENGTFAQCSNLTSVTIPNSVTSIGAHAFFQCNSLTSITIPSVISIGFAVFANCSSLTSVTIGNSVTSISNSAFYDCSGLTSITCEATTPPILGSDVFYNVNKSIPLCVPSQSILAYQQASYWSDFTNIQAISQN